MSTSSPHLVQIPQAVQIAASTDPSIDPNLKQQAIDYLNNVRSSCEETWQDCLSLYLQGAGAAGPSSHGKDGKQKLDADLRVYCEQVVDAVFIHTPGAITTEGQEATYSALVDFVQTEWVNGPCEGGQAFFRNKLSTTLAYHFLTVYPNVIRTYLHPFFALLRPPPSSSSINNFHPVLLALRLLSEIAMEIHDPVMKSARAYIDGRASRDGVIRDVIRTSGDEKLAVEGMLNLATKGLDQVAAGDRGTWLDLVDQSMRTLASWTPWIDLSTVLTPDSLSFYRQLLGHSVMSLRLPAAAVYKTFVSKGIKIPAERLQVFQILDIVATLDPLEAATKESKDEETVAFRAAIGGVLQVFGSELVTYVMAEDTPEEDRKQAEGMLSVAIPLLLRFLADRRPDVILSVGAFVSDLLRRFKTLYSPKPVPKGQMPPPPVPPPAAIRQLLSTILDTSIRQLAWPEDMDWEPLGGVEPDPDDDLATLTLVRTTCRTFIESIAAIDKSLHNEVVARIVGDTLEALQSGGPNAVPWQQVELALHLVYSFGELNKSNTRAAFYDLPSDLSTKSGRDRIRRISINKAHIDNEAASGRSTPSSDLNDDVLAETQPGVYYGGRERIDYDQYPLTPLGQLLTLCMSSGVVKHPHPAVTLQYFELGVRYVDFWKSKPSSTQPIVEAMLDQRGVHHPDENVRRRCFYLFTKFIKECKVELEPELIPPILDSLKDAMVIDATLPDPDFPDEDVLVKATSGKTYFQDQLHLFEAAGNLVSMGRNDADKQLSQLQAVAGPLINSLNDGRRRPQDTHAVLRVHHDLMALGNFAKGFPPISDTQTEAVPYQSPFAQMTQVLLAALDGMKAQRIVRDAARFAFSQFVTVIGSPIAELVPTFVSHVVTEFEPSELVDFLLFLNLLMHRLKSNAFQTMDLLLLPLLSRIFAVLEAPITGTDEATVHRRLKDAYLSFFTALMNANLDGVFISDRNKPEFENVLSALLSLATSFNDNASQRLAIAFFAKSVIAWGTSPATATEPSVFAESALSYKSKQVANGLAAPTNQHAISKEERAKQALPGYERFIYERLLPMCFEVPANPKFNIRTGIQNIHELAMLIRNTVQARGQESIDFLLNDQLPKINCPPDVAEKLVTGVKTQQARDFRKTFADFVKLFRS